MSKTWYPVIDYGKCMECGVCTDKCQHGVYDQQKAPTPIVVQPENCVHGCRGCGELCPAEAISYVGENNRQSNSCGCGCSDDSGGCCG
ncbi:4Fe-4S binding protein [Dehalobacter sp. DCM]|uniref:ATP-binding protein n=1 Tax=Dehalobacter sp. DCM TaxID=2907827 RepID=UPI0030818682|nr:4Fe-4S binding protein [Dehalobacter sp. DCM]